jgi:hypothetical protein
VNDILNDRLTASASLNPGGAPHPGSIPICSDPNGITNGGFPSVFFEPKTIAIAFLIGPAANKYLPSTKHSEQLVFVFFFSLRSSTAIESSNAKSLGENSRAYASKDD